MGITRMTQGEVVRNRVIRSRIFSYGDGTFTDLTANAVLASSQIISVFKQDGNYRPVLN